MLLLGEGDVEWQNEDQVTLAGPADPNCSDPTQRGKTWITRKAYGMYSKQSSAPINTILSAYLMNSSYGLQKRS